MTNNEARIAQRLRELSDVLKEAEFRAVMGWGDQTAYIINQARMMVSDIVADVKTSKSGKR